MQNRGPSCSWPYGSWIYNYLCNQCLSPLTLWVRIPIRRGVLETTLCDQGSQLFAAGRWFSSGPLVSSINKTDRHDITEILLKQALHTTNQPLQCESNLGQSLKVDQLNIQIWLIWFWVHKHDLNIVMMIRYINKK